MATEDFKLLTEELYANYVKLHQKFQENNHKINLSFKEYLDFYIEYEKEGLDSGYDDYEDDEDLESEEDSE